MHEQQVMGLDEGLGRPSAGPFDEAGERCRSHAAPAPLPTSSGAKATRSGPVGPDEGGAVHSGPVRRCHVDADAIADLTERGMRRRRPDPLPRSVAGVASQLGWVELMQRFELDTFFTMTFSDQYADDHYIRTNTSALNNFERWVKHTSLPGNYFVAPEPHLCRDSPHLHGLLQAGSMPRRVLWADWFSERGRARLDPPRSDAAATYCAKYAIKEGDTDGFRFRFLNPAQAAREAARR
jgi:hypothetical protein